MIVVLDSPAHAAGVLSALAGVSAQSFLRASPPLISIPDGDEALAAQIARQKGVREVLQAPGPLLASRALTQADAIIHVGPVRFGGREIPVIAGPCSVEDEAQVTGLAGTVRDAGASLLRGGAYKGRTSPFAFQGHGAGALPLLAAARSRSGLPVVTEVVASEDLAEVAETADLLQVGARNMHNTALLKALGRVHKPVLLKRGFGSTVEELLYAADYILAEGNGDVILCERGIRTFERGVRFSFDLSAFALLKARSRLPVVVDPSHAVGDARLVATVAKAAVAAGADGLLIEVHDSPDEAWSDGEQALTPAAFAMLMRELAPIAAAVGRQLQTT